MRLPDHATPFVTAFRVIPGIDDPTIALTRRRPEPLPRGVTAIALLPSGRTFQVTATSERRLRGQIVLGGLGSDFWDALSGANELQLRSGARVRRRISLPEAAAAVAAVRQCVSQAMREWGVDEGALSALRQRPSSTNLLGMRASDYPAEAIRYATQGQVVVRIAVSTDGRAKECVPVGPSGSPTLDDATCQVILARARFRPAIAADGQPTAARIITAIVWRMP
ncbi:MAG TPA: energy transducer TonB [Allosphingosinicella sp.]|nr:energy transducer TonB [Allosphingosinicella sp.]